VDARPFGGETPLTEGAVPSNSGSFKAFSAASHRSVIRDEERRSVCGRRTTNSSRHTGRKHRRSRSVSAVTAQIALRLRPRRRASRVVDDLEMVHIEHEQREREAPSSCCGRTLPGKFEEVAAVVDLREAIRRGELEQESVFLPQLRLEILDFQMDLTRPRARRGARA